jgi:hypothetical protein
VERAEPELEIAARRVRYDYDGGVLRVKDTASRLYGTGEYGRRSFTMRARIDDETARGTLSFVEAVIAADGSTYECRSGPVAFSARTVH